MVLEDGGYIVELEQRGYIVTRALTSEIAITHTEAVREVHREMRMVGGDVLQVMAFYDSREKLATVGYSEKTFEINRAATRITREVADQAGVDLLIGGGGNSVTHMREMARALGKYTDTKVWKPRSDLPMSETEHSSDLKRVGPGS